MRKVIASTFISLDGLIAGANGELDWFIGDEETQRELRALHNRVDTLLLGRLTYQQFAPFWPTAPSGIPGFDHMNRSSKVVFSTTLNEAPWGVWDNARVANDPIAEEIQRLKAQPGRDMVLYASANLMQAFTQLGLIDEYHLLVHPLLLGRGKPYFGDNEPLNLRLTQAARFQSGVVALHYEPVKA